MIRFCFSLIFFSLIYLNLYAGKYLEVKESLKELRGAIKNDPNECLNYYKLGLYFLSEGKYDSAEVQFRKTLDFDSHFAGAWVGLYVTKLANSELLFIECLRENPSAHSRMKVKEANMYLRLAFMMDPFFDWRPAIVFFKYYKEIEGHPLLQEFVEDIWHFFLEGVSRFFLGEYKDAIKELDIRLEKYPKNYHFFFIRGLAHAKQKDFAQAVEDFRYVQDSLIYFNSYKFLPVKLTPAVLDFMIGDCYLKLNNLEKAEKQFQKYVTDDSTFFTAYLQLSRLYQKSGEYNRAFKMLDRAIDIKPEDPVLHFNRGAILAKLGRVNDAIGEYRKAIGYNPRFYKVYFNLALVMEAIGRKQEAIDCYQKFIDYTPKGYQKFINQARMKMDDLKK